MLDKILTTLVKGMDTQHAAEPYVSPVFRDVDFGPFGIGFATEPVYDGVQKARRGYDDPYMQRAYEIYNSLLAEAKGRGWEVRPADSETLRHRNPNKNEKTVAYENTDDSNEVIEISRDADMYTATVALAHEMIGKTKRLERRRPHKEMEYEILTETERMFSQGPYALEPLAAKAREFRTNYEMYRLVRNRNGAINATLN